MRFKVIWPVALIILCVAVCCNYYLGGDRYFNLYTENQILLDIAPPVAGSEDSLRDKEVFLQTRIYQNNPRWQKAIQDSDLTPSNILGGFDCSTQRQMAKYESPEFQSFYYKTITEVNRLTRKSKKHFMQKRPFKLYEGATCAPVSGFDYPSGHAMIGWVTARLFADIYPERKEQLFNHARSFAESRVICGFHSVSAVEVAEYYSEKIMEHLKTLPSFQRDLAVVKEQMQAVPKLEGDINSCEQFPAQIVKPFPHKA